MFGLVCICRFKIRTLGGIFQAVRRKETNNCLLLMLTQHHNYGDDQPIRVSIFLKISRNGAADTLRRGGGGPGGAFNTVGAVYGW